MSAVSREASGDRGSVEAKSIPSVWKRGLQRGRKCYEHRSHCDPPVSHCHSRISQALCCLGAQALTGASEEQNDTSCVFVASHFGGGKAKWFLHTDEQNYHRVLVLGQPFQHRWPCGPSLTIHKL